MTSGTAVMTHVYAQRSDILQDWIDDDLFLVDTRANKIHALNSMAAIIWEMLNSPATVDELLPLFIEVFPDVTAGKLKRDVQDALDTMSRIDVINVTERPRH